MEDMERERLRSPNYPAFGLDAAIERIHALYKRDGKAAVPSVAAVKAWGYTSLNGRSMRVIAALRQYGLLEYTSSKMVKLSQTALTLLLAVQGSEEHKRAMRSAAIAPPSFAKLYEEYDGEFPSDESMIHRLVADGNYSEDAARGLIAALRDTITLLEATEAKPDPQRDASDRGPKDGTRRPADQKPKEAAAMPDPGREFLDLPIPLVTGGQAILRLPRFMSETDFAMLTNMIGSMLKGMKAALVVPAQPQEPETVDVSAADVVVEED